MEFLENISQKPLLKICAPMVRYSRLPFRTLVKEYDCDLCFSPMIMSDSFIKSESCRKAEFITNPEDKPLIVQFAAKNPTDFAEATELVYNNCNGVDLNCGCPQRWAIQEGIGSCLLKKPEVVADILKQTRNRISDPNFTVSVKIRVYEDLVRTVDMCRQLEASGINFISVHGRTQRERAQPVRIDTIKTIVDSLDIPVIANGDIDSLEKAYHVQEITGVRGVMSANALIQNPALYAGYDETPISVIKRWIEINESLNSHFTMFHRHLISMTETILTKIERRVFNYFKTKEEVIYFLNQKFNLGFDHIEKPESFLLIENYDDIVCGYGAPVEQKQSKIC